MLFASRRALEPTRDDESPSMRKILSEHQCLGLLVQQANYSWQADAEMSECDSAVTLKYVPAHRPVHARLCDGGEHRVGRMVLTPAGREVTARAARAEAEMHSLVFHFEPGWLERVWRPDLCVRVSDIPLDVDVRSATVEGTLARLSNELSRPDLASTTMVESLAQILAIDLGRYIETCRAADAPCRSGLSRKRLEQIQDFVINFESGAPSLGEIAAECVLSPSHLRRLFKQTTGLTLQEYVEKVRIEKARALLSEPGLPMKVISYRLGYSHPSAFSVAFKRATGETAQAYRQRASRNPVTPNAASAQWSAATLVN